MRALPAAEPDRRLTFEEWLEHEGRTEVRSELVAGELVLVQGGSERHDLVVSELQARLRSRLRQDGCLVFTHNRKVRVPTGDGFYPDLLVRCGRAPDPQYEDAPEWIVEVLSPSNTVREMQDKLAGYLALPSLRGYLVIEPETERVVVYLRLADSDDVVVHDVTGASVEIRSVPVDLADLFGQVGRDSSF